MDSDIWFSHMSNFAMIGWGLLVLYPKRQAWLLQLTGLIMPALMGVGYAVFMLPNLVGATGAGYGSLSQVMTLFTHEELVVAGWIHYLAFDLAVGTFIAAHSDRIGVSRIIQIPLLFLTLMFGPIGFMAFVFMTFTHRMSSRLFKDKASSGALS